MARRLCRQHYPSSLVYMDQHLIWCEHIAYISRKIAINISILSRIHNFLPKWTLQGLFYSLIFTYIFVILQYILGCKYATRLKSTVHCSSATTVCELLSLVCLKYKWNDTYCSHILNCLYVFYCFPCTAMFRFFAYNLKWSWNRILCTWFELIF